MGEVIVLVSYSRSFARFSSKFYREALQAMGKPYVNSDLIT